MTSQPDNDPGMACMYACALVPDMLAHIVMKAQYNQPH